MNVLLLLSGGIDSACLAGRARAAGVLRQCVWFRYPHPAAPYEHAAVQRLRIAWDLPVLECSPPIMGAEALQSGVGAAGPRIVAARNLLFLAHGINMAAAIGCDRVWFGASRGDHEYPDCSPEFVRSLSTLGAPWGVTVEAPLLDAPRDQIVAELGKYNPPEGGLWSCYEPKGGAPCGTCNSCRQ